MKNLIYLIALIFAIIISSCTDDDNLEDNPDEGGRLRITKMAYNKYLDYPIVFEYDSNNLLVKITTNWGNDGVYTIENDSEGKPIKINGTYSDAGYIETNTVNIQWTSNGFMINYESGHSYTVLLDKQNRVIGINKYGEYDDKFTWYGNDSLLVQDLVYDDIEKYIFNDYKHPLSEINIAVILITDISLGEWEVEWQNNYCISEYGDYYKGNTYSPWIRNEYVVNEQNYPILLETRYLDEDGDIEYLSFEYESY